MKDKFPQSAPGTNVTKQQKTIAKVRLRLTQQVNKRESLKCSRYILTQKSNERESLNSPTYSNET